MKCKDLVDYISLNRNNVYHVIACLALSMICHCLSCFATIESNIVSKTQCYENNGETISINEVPVIMASSQVAMLQDMLIGVLDGRKVTKETLEVDLAYNISFLLSCEEDSGMPIEDWDPELISYAAYREAVPLTDKMLSKLSHYDANMLLEVSKKVKQLREDIIAKKNKNHKKNNHPKAPIKIDKKVENKKTKGQPAHGVISTNSPPEQARLPALTNT